MHTKIISVHPQNPEMNIIREAAQLLRNGELVAFPTETVYGLGANGLDVHAVERVFAAKERALADPIILHISDMEMLKSISLVPDMSVLTMLAGHFWPGPLTLVVPAHPDIPSVVTAGLSTVAVRFPAHPVALTLIQEAGIPLTGPSANRFMHVSPTTAQHVYADLNGRISLVLDSGPCSIGVESTIVDISVDPPAILRYGGLPLEDIQKVLPSVQSKARSSVHQNDESIPMKAPGQLSKHYAPQIPFHLYTGDVARAVDLMSTEILDLRMSSQHIGVLAGQDVCDQIQTHVPDTTKIVSLGNTAEEAAVRLYMALRELESSVDLIIGYSGFHDGVGYALHDRLVRASGGNVTEL